VTAGCVFVRHLEACSDNQGTHNESLRGKMRAIFVIFLCLFLSGCFLDPAKDLLSCQLANTSLRKSSDINAAAEDTFVVSNRIELCMAERGYEIAQRSAPQCSNDLGSDLTRSAPRKLAQATSAICYAPKQWVMQQVLALERQIHQIQ